LTVAELEGIPMDLLTHRIGRHRDRPLSKYKAMCRCTKFVSSEASYSDQ
jgi:hypothetical protein